MHLDGAAVAVTDATGFLGRYINEALRERGAHVIGVVRDPDPDASEQCGVTLRRADLSAREELVRAFEGADAVVSNAALFSLRNQNWDEHVRSNIHGTENVLRAAAEAGVRRVVHVSSVAVYRGRQPLLDEDHPRLPESTRPGRSNAYSLSKAIAEQKAWELARRLELELTTIRPSGIYGAQDENFTAAFRSLMRLPVTVFPAFFGLPLVYAGDVAEAIALALEKPVAVGKAYNIAGEDRTAWEFARAWSQAGGRAPWLKIPIPVPYRRSFDTSRARRELGWRARPYLDGLRETLSTDAPAEEPTDEAREGAPPAAPPRVPLPNADGSPGTLH